MRRRRKKIPKAVSTHFSRQKASGLSIADYCKENNISASTFYGWNKRYKEPSFREKQSASANSFIEIPLSNSRFTTSSRIVVTRTEIQIPSETAELVREVLNMLQSPV